MQKASSEPRDGNAGTRVMLAAGVAAGPVYLLVAAVQAATREGFDLRRHPVSFLAIGEHGWVQIANFVVSGLLVLIAAAGMRQALDPGASKWGPRLVGSYGLGLVASGLLVADPGFGFPPGTPGGPPAEVSWHGLGHFVAGGVGFLALVAACFVFARLERRRAWGRYSRATGTVFLASFAAVAGAGGASWANLIFAVGVVLAWAWLSTMAWRILDSQADFRGRGANR